MDIFFCDLCGARVSDADLRAGHGTRRRWDVICGACLEQGHGQAWLSQRAGVKADVAAAVAASAPTAPAPSAAAAVLDAPRDRARTLEEDEEEPAKPVSGRAVALESSGGFVREDHEATTRVPQEGQVAPQLSAAAGAFARLGADESAPAVEPRDDVDDVREELPGNGVTPTPAPAVSPFAFDAKAGKEGEEDAPDAEAPAKNPSGTRTKSPAAPRKSSPSSSRVAGKPASKTSGRIAKPTSGRRPANPDSGRKILMITAVTSFVLIVGIVVVLLQGPKKGAPKKIEINVTKELEAKIGATKAEAIAAIKADDPGKLRAAHDSIQRMSSELDSFEATTKKQGGWTEEQVENWVDRSGWPQVYSLDRTIRDALVKHGGK